MQKTIDKNKLSFLIIPTRFCPPDYQHILQDAYNVWKDIWSKAYKEEMAIQDQITSDGFSRHTYVAIIFYDNSIVCLTTLNDLDLNQEMAWDDTYFKVWPEILKEKLKRISKRSISICNFSLVEEFRGKTFGINWKDLMLALEVRYFKNSKYDSMIAEARVERSMGNAAYRNGATFLAKNLPYEIEGQFIDIVLWDKNSNQNKIDPNIQSLVDHMWEKSSHIIDYHTEVKSLSLIRRQKDAA